MNRAGPPSQSEIDYGCAVQITRRERKRRSLFMTLAVFTALCVATMIVSFAFGIAWGLR